MLVGVGLTLPSMKTFKKVQEHKRHQKGILTGKNSNSWDPRLPAFGYLEKCRSCLSKCTDTLGKGRSCRKKTSRPGGSEAVVRRLPAWSETWDKPARQHSMALLICVFSAFAFCIWLSFQSPSSAFWTWKEIKAVLLTAWHVRMTNLIRYLARWRTKKEHL